MKAVSIVDVRKNYGTLPVLKGLSLDIVPGEFVVLLGPSGCGKSTLLHAIAGLDDIDSGDIRIDGRSVVDHEPKDRGIAMVFQSYALYPTMNVRKNLSFGLRMNGAPKAEIDSRVEKSARLLQIEELLDRKPSQLSGGQRQRVAIGRALVREAAVFLFDEPLSNLDAKLRTEMRLELKRLHGALGATMIYVTHDQVEAMTMADRIAVLRAGNVEQFATPQQLYDKPANLFVASFVGSPEVNRIAGTLAARDGRRVEFVAGSLVVDVSGYAFAQPPPADIAAVLTVRAEDLRLTVERPALDAAAVLAARPVTREPLGSETLVWCLTDAGRICVRTRPEQAGPPMDSGFLHIDVSRVSLFDAQSTQRL